MTSSRLGLLVLLFLMGPGSAWTGEVSPVGPEALSEWLDAPGSPLLLDVRGRVAYLEGTVSGALHAGTDPRGFLPDSRGGDAVLILAEGAQVEPWRARLTDFGYRVHVLTGGMRAWRAAGLPGERPEESFVRPGTVPFVIPRGICEMNEPVQVFD